MLAATSFASNHGDAPIPLNNHPLLRTGAAAAAPASESECESGSLDPAVFGVRPGAMEVFNYLRA